MFAGASRVTTFAKKKNSTSTISRWMKLVLRFVIATLALYALYSAYIIGERFVTADSRCSLCDSKLELLKERKDLSSTLFVVKSPVENRIAGAWLVISNDNLARTVVFYIPPGVYIDDPNDLFRSSLPLSDLEYAGDLINPDRSVEYVIWQIGNMTGFTVENYFWLDASALKYLTELYGDPSEYTALSYKENYKNPVEISDAALFINSLVDHFSYTKTATKSKSWEKYVESLDTNVSSMSIMSELYSMKMIFRAGDVVMVDLSQPGLFRTYNADNGREVLTVNYSEYDKVIQDNFNIVRSRSVEKEQARVEVYNGSGIPGLASRYARKVYNYGVKVVRYDNSPTEFEKTTIYVSHRDRFAQSFSSVEDLVCDKCEIIEGRPDFITTGDIIVILGKDKEKELRWR